MRGDSIVVCVSVGVSVSVVVGEWDIVLGFAEGRRKRRPDR
jgi:hypothetical protein